YMQSKNKVNSNSSYPLRVDSPIEIFINKVTKYSPIMGKLLREQDNETCIKFLSNISNRAETVDFLKNNYGIGRGPSIKTRNRILEILKEENTVFDDIFLCLKKEDKITKLTKSQVKLLTSGYCRENPINMDNNSKEIISPQRKNSPIETVINKVMKDLRTLINQNVVQYSLNSIEVKRREKIQNFLKTLIEESTNPKNKFEEFVEFLSNIDNRKNALDDLKNNFKFSRGCSIIMINMFKKKLNDDPQLNQELLCFFQEKKYKKDVMVKSTKSQVKLLTSWYCRENPINMDNNSKEIINRYTDSTLKFDDACEEIVDKPNIGM
ncbi:MAG: hypothetical protein GY782_04100, partial [Gammaproteobacteria bacterium]|nr:hypothetical protein [Gammaproteobacteria bacterium]